MVEYKVVAYEWVELAPGYGYYNYTFERVGEMND